MNEVFGTVAMVLAVAGVLLNNRLNISCFYLWLISIAICAGLHADVGLWSLFVRDIIFLILVVEGWVRWSKRKD